MQEQTRARVTLLTGALFFGRTFVGACEGKACSGGTIRLFIEIA